MTPELLWTTLERLMGQRPFIPFTIMLRDGNSLRVNSSRSVAYRVGTPIAFFDANGKFQEIQLSNIVDMVESEPVHSQSNPMPIQAGKEPMTAEQFDNTINSLCSQIPFHPFTIEFVNGSRIEIDHSRGILNSNGTAFMLLPGGKPLWFGSDTVSKIIGEMSSELAS